MSSPFHDLISIVCLMTEKWMIVMMNNISPTKEGDTERRECEPEKYLTW